MTKLIAIDPGMTSGVFVGEYDDMSPLLRTGYAQIPGGIKGFSRWMDDAYPDIFGATVVCEKFVPLPMARSWKLDELEPIRIEGLLYDYWTDRIVWQRSMAMVLRDGATQAERKKNSDDLLRRNGWWLTGKDVGLKDANDANAAAKHALAYMRSIGHMPTIETHLR